MRLWYFLLLPLLAFAAEPEAVAKPVETEVEEVQPEADNVQSPISSDMYRKQFFRTLIVIVIIGVIAIVLISLMRRYAKNRPFQVNHKKNIKILERRQISPVTFLYHIQIGNKQIVISESKNEVRVVANLDWDETELPS